MNKLGLLDSVALQNSPPTPCQLPNAYSVIFATLSTRAHTPDADGWKGRFDKPRITHVIRVLAPSLAFLFNQSSSSGIVPAEWKLARVTPIFKKGKRQDVNNYRPISIIPGVAKVFERKIYDQFFEVS